jgi:hypothetical protein
MKLSAALLIFLVMFSNSPAYATGGPTLITEWVDCVRYFPVFFQQINNFENSGRAEIAPRVVVMVKDGFIKQFFLGCINIEKTIIANKIDSEPRTVAALDRIVAQLDARGGPTLRAEMDCENFFPDFFKSINDFEDSDRVEILPGFVALLKVELKDYALACINTKKLVIANKGAKPQRRRVTVIGPLANLA